MQKVYYGPFTIAVDHDNEVTQVILKRRGPESWRLLDGELSNLRDYVMARAAEFGFPVVGDFDT